MSNKIYKITDLIGSEELLGKKVQEVNTKEVYIVKGNTLETECYDDIADLWELHTMFGMGFELVEEIKPKKAIHENAKIYIGGSLFSEAEIAQRLKEEDLLRKAGYENIFNPINADCNQKSNLPTAKDIFRGDTKEVLSSDIVVADISNSTDLGVACELSIVWCCNYIHQLASNGLDLEGILKIMKKKRLITHLSDIRKGTSHLYQGNNIPFGFNQFEIGMIEDTGVIKDNFAEVLEELK